MLGTAIMSAAREAAEGLDRTFDPEAWAGVLVEILAPRRGPRTGEVIGIETLRLIPLARRGDLNGELFADDNGVA
jgi:hypothetical protein